MWNSHKDSRQVTSRIIVQIEESLVQTEAGIEDVVLVPNLAGLKCCKVKQEG